MTRRRLAVAIAMMLAGGCGDRRDARELEREIATLTDVYQPLIDDLVARIRHLKRDMGRNLRGWEDALRTAQLASDAVGLAPFEQLVPPGPAFRSSPGSLLGMGLFAKQQAAALVAADKIDELVALLDRTRLHYFVKVLEASHDIDEVDYWLLHPGPFLPFADPAHAP